MHVFRIISLFTALVAMSACATNLEKGKELATAGRVASETLQKSAAETADDYRLNARRSALLQQLAKAQNPVAPLTMPAPDTEGFLKNASLLQTRATMLDELVKLYSNLEEGMKFNARDDTRTAFLEFVGAVDAYQAAVNAAGGNLADRPETQGIGQLVGLFAEAIQKKKMRQASALVRRELVAVRHALQEEMRLLISARTSSMLLKRNLAEALRQQGLADSSPRIEEWANLADVPKAPDAAEAYQGSARLKRSLGLYDVWDNETFQPQLVEASYVKSLEVVGELEKQHVKFEKGEPLTLDRLVSLAEELRAIHKLLAGDAS